MSDRQREAMPGTGVSRLWVARHGQTEWSRSGQYTGLTDLPLTPEGEAQAAAAADRVQGMVFDEVLTSPLRRAARTAELMGFPDAAMEPEAVEWDYGDYEGVRSADVRAGNPGYLIWDDGVPGGETLEQVAARADRIVDRVLRAGAARTLLVCHGHFSRILAARWLGLPPGAGRHFVMETAHVSVLGWDKRTPAIEAWNL